MRRERDPMARAQALEQELSRAWRVNQWQALAWSLLVEVPVVWALGRGVDRRRLVGVALAATFLTHPFAIAGFAALRPHLSYAARAVVVESGVALVEGALYWRVGGLPPGRAWGASVAANAASYLSGVVLRAWVL
jgi:hypothetical protein